MQWCSTEGSVDGVSTAAGLDEDSPLELAEQSVHAGSWGLELALAGFDAEGPSVVYFHLAAQNEAGDTFVEVALSLELGILNTMWRTGGPTYCGVAGDRSTIDYVLVPLSGSGCIQKVVTCWKLGRKLQLIPAAHSRDHPPVLVLLSLRMRRVGQDQLRAQRWDFDRMAIALQQGSAERESFLKVLDKHLCDQSEQLEAALSAPAAGDSWKLLGTDDCGHRKEFFSLTKALHTTEETRWANHERWALLRLRQGLRQQLGATAGRVDALESTPLSCSGAGQEAKGCIQKSPGPS